MSYFIYSFFIFFISRWSAMCLKGKTTKYIHIFIISIGVSGPENNLSFFFSCSRSEKKRKRAKKSVGRLVWGVIRSSTFSNVRCLLQAGRLNKNLAAALFFSGSISCLRFISKWVLAGNVALQVYIELLIILCFVVVSRPAVTCSGLQQLAVLNHPFVKKNQKKNAQGDVENPARTGVAPWALSTPTNTKHLPHVAPLWDRVADLKSSWLKSCAPAARGTSTTEGFPFILTLILWLKAANDVRPAAYPHLHPGGPVTVTGALGDSQGPSVANTT